MPIISDTLVVRTISILILGSLIIAGDFLLVYYFFTESNLAIWHWLLLASIVLTGLVLIAWIISRQLINPLQQLSKKAKRFSADLQAEPLPLKGPKEVREAARSFNEMQERIQRFVEERMQLIAAISHDLRTPLTRLKLRIDAIPDQEQKQKALTEIDDMNTMIQSTLLFIREDNSKEVAVKINLSSLLQTLCDETTYSLGPAEYHGPNNLILQCKPVSIKRALSNLIENAVKFGGQATVNLQKLENVICVTIEDTGPGIPESESVKVFLPFYRLEKSRNKQTGGVGLGLSVAKTIIQSHGGDIVLENKTSGGLIAKALLPV